MGIHTADGGTATPGVTPVSMVWGRGHARHAPAAEVQNGRQLPAFDRPERIDVILDRLSGGDDFVIKEASSHGMSPIKAVHDEGLLEALAACSQACDDDATFADTFEHVRLREDMGNLPARRDPTTSALLGRFCFDTITAITRGTYSAAIDAANCAVSAAELVGEHEPLVVGLTRPPGHHASRRLFGGATFLNNASIAAEHLRRSGHGRVGVLDIDAHHGNGTQSIFYDRGDVLTVSLHADPTVHFPHFTGYPDERGYEDGSGFNLNLVLSDKAQLPECLIALEAGLEALRKFDPDVLVVSLGFDGHIDDPGHTLALQTDDFHRIGAEIAGLGKPTLALLEGGYALNVLGDCMAGWVEGFCD